MRGSERSIGRQFVQARGTTALITGLIASIVPSQLSDERLREIRARGHTSVVTFSSPDDS
ncbi:protein of unknown function (plasmid) [Pararobbsia alpina]